MKDLNKLLGKLGKEVARVKENVDKIDNFLNTEGSNDLDREEKELMIAQKFIFNSLADIITKRMRKIEKRKN